MQIIQSIQNRIYEIRGERVMLDLDLAALYEVETRVLNQAVKRNTSRFPKDFMFKLSAREWNDMRSQIVTSSVQIVGNQNGNSSQSVTTNNLTSQNVTSSWGGTRKLPYAFTEHGVTMLASVLRSHTAVKMNIAIVRAFIALRKFAVNYDELTDQLKDLKDRVGNHDGQLNQIYEAMENLLDEKAAQRKWEDRQRIGFKN